MWFNYVQGLVRIISLYINSADYAELRGSQLIYYI